MGSATGIIEQKRTAFAEYLEEVRLASQDVLDAIYLAQGGEGDCPAQVSIEKFDISSEERVSFKIASVDMKGEVFDSFVKAAFPATGEAFSRVVTQQETVVSQADYFLREINRVAEANGVPAIDTDFDLSPNPNVAVGASSAVILLAKRRANILDRFSNDIADAFIANGIATGEIIAGSLKEQDIKAIRDHCSLKAADPGVHQKDMYIFRRLKTSHFPKEEITESLEYIVEALNSSLGVEYQIDISQIPELPVAPARTR